MTETIGVDVGGTKIAAGAVTEDGTIVDQARIETPVGTSSTLVEAIIEAVTRLTDRAREAGRSIGAVGIGAAGMISSNRDIVYFAPNLPWRNEALGPEITGATGLPTIVENDANAAAWGEFRFGAAANETSAVVVTVGTGIGGGVISDGKLVRGFNGFAGEIGHINLVRDGLKCGCGLHGCWEQYASGRALTRIGQRLAAENPDRAHALLRADDGSLRSPGDLTGFDIAQAAHGGDELALQAFTEVGTYLGWGLADVCALLDPEVIVLAGGVSENGEILRAPTEASLAANITAASSWELPKIKLAELGNLAGLIGAADLARDAL